MQCFEFFKDSQLSQVAKMIWRIVIAFSILFTVKAAASVDINDAIKTMNIKINDLYKRIYSLQSTKSYCSLVKDDPCGPCKCADDFRQEKKYYCDCTGLTPQRDCRAFYEQGYRYSGVYFIDLNGRKLTQVFCDQETSGGGWTVIQRRRDGSVNFYRNWKDYKEGFGDVRNEFWFGNQKIFIYTHQSLLDAGTELRVDLKHPRYPNLFFVYDQFQVGNELSKYQMHVSLLTNGTKAGSKYDGLAGHNNIKFSTYDNDNDPYSGSCAIKYKSGGWFHGGCFHTNLNGQYRKDGESPPSQGIHWMYPTYGGTTSFLFVEMKLRRK